MIPTLDLITQMQRANAVAAWLELMAGTINKFPSGDKNADMEAHMFLLSAQGALLRWRLGVGVLSGLVALEPSGDFEDEDLRENDV